MCWNSPGWLTLGQKIILPGVENASNQGFYRCVQFRYDAWLCDTDDLKLNMNMYIMHSEVRGDDKKFPVRDSQLDKDVRHVVQGN